MLKLLYFDVLNVSNQIKVTFSATVFWRHHLVAAGGTAAARSAVAVFHKI